MTSIELTSITGVFPPYTVYACDVYGAFCIPIATISVGVPPPNTIILPPAFAFAPAVGIKISGETCNRFEVFFCQDLFPANVCFRIRISMGGTNYNHLYFNFTIDENINGKPSWVGSIFGTPQTLYWDGTQWIIDPFGITNSNEDLTFGTWLNLGSVLYSLYDFYCPSICIIFFVGGVESHFFLQSASYYFNSPPLGDIPYYYYSDGITDIQVIWNFMTNEWNLNVNGSLYATLTGLTSDDTPIGTWILDPIIPPGSNITTVLECPQEFKQFQNTEDFYFMDGIQYNFQT